MQTPAENRKKWNSDKQLFLPQHITFNSFHVKVFGVIFVVSIDLFGVQCDNAQIGQNQQRFVDGFRHFLLGNAQQPFSHENLLLTNNIASNSLIMVISIRKNCVANNKRTAVFLSIFPSPSISSSAKKFLKTIFCSAQITTFSHENVRIFSLKRVAAYRFAVWWDLVRRRCCKRSMRFFRHRTRAENAGEEVVFPRTSTNQKNHQNNRNFTNEYIIKTPKKHTSELKEVVFLTPAVKSAAASTTPTTGLTTTPTKPLPTPNGMVF